MSKLVATATTIRRPKFRSLHHTAAVKLAAQAIKECISSAFVDERFPAIFYYTIAKLDAVIGGKMVTLRAYPEEEVLRLAKIVWSSSKCQRTWAPEDFPGTLEDALLVLAQNEKIGPLARRLLDIYLACAQDGKPVHSLTPIDDLALVEAVHLIMEMERLGDFYREGYKDKAEEAFDRLRSDAMAKISDIVDQKDGPKKSITYRVCEQVIANEIFFDSALWALNKLGYPSTADELEKNVIDVATTKATFLVQCEDPSSVLFGFKQQE